MYQSTKPSWYVKRRGYLGCKRGWITCSWLPCIDDRNLKTLEAFYKIISINLILCNKCLQNYCGQPWEKNCRKRLMIKKQPLQTAIIVMGRVYLPDVLRNMIFHILCVLLVCYIYLQANSNFKIIPYKGWSKEHKRFHIQWEQRIEHDF